ncbi:MAG: hypothetical protein KBG20_02515 [Caldilineaceae bacterium]|nr:hypothetical protein [Caldilineaceae bacterium]MBP8106307.1 hypothetical protein [Caldilineaceae bacterium]MBP8123558.1 hypothetical protein [Caldilineaceae bacterium]MBP9071137.1 hypothetical protein [Caldilineaceae bacterium]
MSARNRWISNGLLFLGVGCLAWFGIAEIQGLRTDPLMPALSAFFIGGTAVLDRLGSQEFE